MVILCTFNSLSVHFSRFIFPYNLVYIIKILYSFYYSQFFPLFDQYLSRNLDILYIVIFQILKYTSFKRY